MLRQPDYHERNVVFAIRRPSGFSRLGFFHLRNWRGLLAVLVAGAYLLSGALHGLHDLDVTNPSGGSEIAATLDHGASHGDHKALASHHCHGCFSAAVFEPVQSVAITDPFVSVKPRRQPAITGVIPDTESPPPKQMA